MYSPLILSLSHRRGSASAAEPPGCSSPSLSLLDAMAAALLLLLAPERLGFGTRPDELGGLNAFKASSYRKIISARGPARHFCSD